MWLIVYVTVFQSLIHNVAILLFTLHYIQTAKLVKIKQLII